MNRKLTRYDLIHRFREDYKDIIEAHKKQHDFPMLRTMWNDMIDTAIREGEVTESAHRWDKPAFVEPKEHTKKDYIVVDIYPNKPTISIRKGKSLLAQIKGDEAALLLAEYYQLKERPDFISYLDKKVDFNVY